MISRLSKLVLVMLVSLLPSQAFAQWHEASSDHFLVIADQNEKDTREFTERLERFHTAMDYILGHVAED